MFAMKKRLGNMAGEVEDSREALLLAQGEAARVSDVLRDLRKHTHIRTHKVLQHTIITLQHTATHCNTLQHTAAHCNTLQHTATHKVLCATHE